jgi:hypothetical protein
MNVELMSRTTRTGRERMSGMLGKVSQTRWKQSNVITVI